MSHSNFEVFKFDKPYDVRRYEYNQIFLYSETNFYPSRMLDIWASYLDTILEPVGWTALWKVPKELCGNGYSDAVLLVMVDSVDFPTLTANVTILDPNSIGNRFDGYDPLLKDLFPVVSQENTSLSVEKTAECIDQLRIFYEFIWRPWDVHMEGFNKPIYIDWKTVYLDVRLKLYCDNLCQENVGYSAANYIWSLTVKGNKLFKITNALNQSSFYTPELLNNVDAENVVTVNQENELLELIANISCWENRWRKNATEDILESCTVVVMKMPTKVSEYIEHINRLSCYIKSEKWDIVNDLPSLSSADKVNVLITNDEIYYARDLSCISQGGRIAGLSDTNRPTITDRNCDGMCFCDLYGQQTTLSDVIFSAKGCREVIIIHSGCQLEMNRVQMLNGNVAIVVHGNASLTADRCDFKGFDIAIVAFPRSFVKLNCCTFGSNKIGIQAFDGSTVQFQDTDESIMQSENSKYLLPLIKSHFTTYIY